MVALDWIFQAMRKAMYLVSTAEALPTQLATVRCYLPEDQQPYFDTGLAKLKLEPREKLVAWLAGKADWGCCDQAGEERFELIQVKDTAP